VEPALLKMLSMKVIKAVHSADAPATGNAAVFMGSADAASATPIGAVTEFMIGAKALGHAVQADAGVNGFQKTLSFSGLLWLTQDR